MAFATFVRLKTETDFKKRATWLFILHKCHFILRLRINLNWEWQETACSHVPNSCLLSESSSLTPYQKAASGPQVMLQPTLRQLVAPFLEHARAAPSQGREQPKKKKISHPYNSNHLRQRKEWHLSIVVPSPAEFICLFVTINKTKRNTGMQGPTFDHSCQLVDEPQFNRVWPHVIT